MIGLRLMSVPVVRWGGIVFVMMVAVGMASSTCFAWQSGSRGPSAGSAAGGGNLFPSSPSSAVQGFSVPVESQSQVFQSFPSSTPFSAPGPLSPPAQFVTPNSPGLAPAVRSNQGSGAAGIPNASLIDPVFQIYDPHSPLDVDHRVWSCFLAKYVVTDSQGINRVRYAAVTAGDRNGLKCYLQQLQATDTRALNRNAQLAFWFNLYNARTVDLVLDNYPIRSVRQIKQNLTDFVGPFDDPGAVNVLGKSLSLNDIESGIVRPVWNDPRIHYGLNCASYGCPNLLSVAWTASNLESNLNNAACLYINSGRAVKSGVLGIRVAKIYKWYKADFGGTDQAVLNHIARYADRRTLNKLSGRSTIAGYFYDWSLNDARITRPRLLEPLIR